MLNEHAVAHQNLGDIWAPGKLDKQKHAPLINEMTRFAQEAGISTRDISGQDEALTDFEKDYLLPFKSHKADGVLGVLYFGEHDPAVSARMKSMCGVLLRNYIGPRFLPREKLIYELWDLKQYPEFDLVCVPDITLAELSQAKRLALQSWVLHRIARGHQTALGLRSKKEWKELMGQDGPYYQPRFKTLMGVIHNV